MVIKLTSPAFKDGEKIPEKYTCDGDNISPPLTWSNIPQNTKMLVIVCEDPDAPNGIWSHWVVYKIPPAETEFLEGIPTTEVLPSGAEQGVNDFKHLGYGGPCPPEYHDAHRYFFRIFALDQEFHLTIHFKRSNLLDAIKGHILDEGHLIGLYKRAGARKAGQAR